MKTKANITIKEDSLSDKLRRSKTHYRSHRKVSRNELCPCGSGLKFKKCCIDIAE